MKTTRALLVTVASFCVAASATAQTADTGFLNRSVVVEGADYAYQVYVPRGYRPSVASPLILALHGGGERGGDGQLQTEVGLGRALRRHADRYPAIVVFPQTPLMETWQDLGARVAVAALDKALLEFSVDRSRVYLTGLSMGGNGSWYLAYRHADRFAAAVVVCGWISERRNAAGTAYPGIAPSSAPDALADVARRVSSLPIWLLHGSADQVVPVEESRRMYAALKAVDADVQYTELPGIGHNAWDPAYDLPELPAWLFKQRRP